MPRVLATIDTAILEKLARFAYARVSPDQDVRHEGSYTPDTRDEAESARSALLNALLERPGTKPITPCAHLRTPALPGCPPRAFANWRAARRSAMRNRALDRDRRRDVEQRGTAPIRSPDDLLRVIMAVLDDIQRDLIHKDASSRSLIRAAESEEQEQHWLWSR